MRLTVLLLLAAVAGACIDAPRGSGLGYEEEIAGFRTAKDRMFREGADSPVPRGQRARFPPLAYYPIDADYRVAATLRRTPDRPIIEVPTSTGLTRRMEKVGILGFSIEGEPMQLWAFVDAETRREDRLFVPFGDLTNGTETYPAGRYLDLELMPTGIYDLDFNRAYHPYCYYNVEYDCPFPPPANRLTVPIQAGERLIEVGVFEVGESPGSRIGESTS
jgi:uncharacterized protein